PAPPRWADAHDFCAPNFWARRSAWKDVHMNATPTVLWSRPENERTGTPLLVIFHGYGADEADLFSLAAQFPADFTVASVRAPLQAGPGYSWFPLRNDLSYSVTAVTEAASAVE